MGGRAGFGSDWDLFWVAGLGDGPVLGEGLGLVEEGFLLGMEEDDSQRDLRWLLEEEDGCFGGFGPAILGNSVESRDSAFVFRF